MGGFFSSLFGTEPDPIKPNPVVDALTQHADETEKQMQEDKSDAEQKKGEEAERKKKRMRKRREARDRKKVEEQSSKEAAEARKTRDVQPKKGDEQSSSDHVSPETTRARSAHSRTPSDGSPLAPEVTSANQAPSDQATPWKERVQPVLWPTLREIEEAKERVQYKDGLFHIAVAGVAGSGKSSLINALRGIANKDKGPHIARVGVSETTTEIGRYEDPEAKKPFVWYDIPGAGTLKVPDWEYFHSQGLYVFDCIIVLFNSRFTETDIALLKNCARYAIPSYIVGSKSDDKIRSIVKDMSDSDSDDEEEVGPVQKYKNYPKARAEYIAQISQSIHNNLALAGLTQQRVYLVEKETLRKVVLQASQNKYWQSLQNTVEWLRAQGMPAEPALTAQAFETGQSTAGAFETGASTIAAVDSEGPAEGAFPIGAPSVGAVQTDAPRKGKSSKANKLDEQVVIHERELIRDMLVEGCNRRVKKWWPF